MTSIEHWAKQAQELKAKGLTDREIGEELHLSPETIAWLLTRKDTGERPPADVKIGWRSLGVAGRRIEMISSIMADVIVEEEERRDMEIDLVVGLAMNGVPLASFISSILDTDLLIYRPKADPKERGEGSFMSNYASVEGKNAVFIDDVISSGTTMKGAIKKLRDGGGHPQLALVMVNKTPHNDLDGVPLRALIRTLSVAHSR
ncbi:MAG: orotate phosphoribosyltransferase-like protein [Thermoplasmata archaeon]|nr:orotate phosphoribosyltransferase-like protein [Thermoplasmata archaeon]